MTVIDVRRTSTAGLTLLVLAGTLWGTGGLTGTLLARAAGLSPVAVAAFRLGTGGLLLIAFLLATRRPLPRTAIAWRRIVVIGLLAAGFQTSYFAAVAHAGVSLATLLTIGASPLLVLLVEWVTGRRRPGRATLLAAGLAVCGLGLLNGVPEEGSWVGGVLALLAAAGFAAMTLIGARPVADLDDMVSTGFAFTLGAAVLVAVAGNLAFTPGPAAIGLLLFLGIGPTATAYAAYFRGLRTAPASTAALLALLEPLVGTVLAVALLGDHLTPWGVLGAILLATALALEALIKR